jgi:hypothetical protein
MFGCAPSPGALGAAARKTIGFLAPALAAITRQLRSMADAEECCALRSYLATAARHGIGALDALTSAFQGRPWIPETG